LGTNIFRDFFAGVCDIVGGRSGSYAKERRKAPMVSANGTAVKLG
jgi:uncharacterized protein YbjQ (UPF0145 family)